MSRYMVTLEFPSPITDANLVWAEVIDASDGIVALSTTANRVHEVYPDLKDDSILIQSVRLIAPAAS